jgi:hypothetical protein
MYGFLLTFVPELHNKLSIGISTAVDWHSTEKSTISQEMTSEKYNYLLHGLYNTKVLTG